jgi:hypothetical protein
VIPFRRRSRGLDGYDLQSLELADGSDLRVEREPNGAVTAILPVDKAEQSFVFGNVAEKPVPSLLRWLLRAGERALRLFGRGARAPHGARP